MEQKQKQKYMKYKMKYMKLKQLTGEHASISSNSVNAVSDKANQVLQQNVSNLTTHLMRTVARLKNNAVDIINPAAGQPQEGIKPLDNVNDYNIVKNLTTINNILTKPVLKNK